jgi:hypothetical protein
MERTYRASNNVFFYAFFLLLDTLALGWDGVGRLRQGLTVSGALLALLALACAAAAVLLLWRWGRVRIIVTPDALLVRGETPPRRIYWADVDRVREIHGPPYQLSLRRLLPGPYLPHTLLRTETVLEVLARPGTRVLVRRALIDGYGSFKEDVLRLISKTAQVDLHGRWWREDQTD